MSRSRNPKQPVNRAAGHPPEPPRTTLRPQGAAPITPAQEDDLRLRIARRALVLVICKSPRLCKNAACRRTAACPRVREIDAELQILLRGNRLADPEWRRQPARRARTGAPGKARAASRPA